MMLDIDKLKIKPFTMKCCETDCDNKDIEVCKKCFTLEITNAYQDELKH